MYKIVGIIIKDGVRVAHDIRCNTDPFIKATNMGFTHGWITKGQSNEIIAVINDDGTIQEV